MFLKITELVRHTLSPFFISKTPGVIPIFGTSPILAYRPISLKIDIFRLTMFYYVIVTSYEDWFSWFHKIVRVCHVDFTCRITVIFGTLKDGSLLVDTSGVARAFPGGRAAPPTLKTKMRKRIKKNWGKMRENTVKWGKTDEMFLSCPTGS